MIWRRSRSGEQTSGCLCQSSLNSRLVNYIKFTNTPPRNWQKKLPRKKSPAENVVLRRKNVHTTGKSEIPVLQNTAQMLTKVLEIVHLMVRVTCKVKVPMVTIVVIQEIPIPTIGGRAAWQGRTKGIETEMEIITIVHMVINGDMVMTGTPAKKDERTDLRRINENTEVDEKEVHGSVVTEKVEEEEGTVVVDRRDTGTETEGEGTGPTDQGTTGIDLIIHHNITTEEMIETIETIDILPVIVNVGRRTGARNVSLMTATSDVHRRNLN